MFLYPSTRSNDWTALYVRSYVHILYKIKRIKRIKRMRLESENNIDINRLM